MLFISIACFYGFKLVLIPEYSSSLKEHSHNFVRRNFNPFIGKNAKCSTCKHTQSATL